MGLRQNSFSPHSSVLCPPTTRDSAAATPSHSTASSRNRQTFIYIILLETRIEKMVGLGVHKDLNLLIDL